MTTCSSSTKCLRLLRRALAACLLRRLPLTTSSDHVYFVVPGCFCQASQLGLHAALPMTLSAAGLGY